MDLTNGKSMSFQQFINMGLLITIGIDKKRDTCGKCLLNQNEVCKQSEGVTKANKEAIGFCLVSI